MNNDSTSSEKYVREQLTSEQNDRLDDLTKKIGRIYFEDKGFAEAMAIASDIDNRIPIETPFIISNTGISKKSGVFDACLGTGSTTIGLKKSGIENVVSNELDDEFIQYSKDYASKYSINLVLTKKDWRRPRGFIKEEFDLVCCLGNSFTYILDPNYQQQVINNFTRILVPGGKLIIDTRNYTEILRGNFLNAGKGPYRAMNKINMTPKYLAPDMSLFRYEYKEKILDLLFYPFKDGEIERLMLNAGLKDIKTFGDYQEKYDPKTTEFYTFIGTKE